MFVTKSFVSYNEEEYIRSISSSGGVFYSISKKIISKNGIVFGAAFDNNWQVYHESVDKIEDLPKLMQSKYVQSSVLNTFREVKGSLISGRLTLYCGTPCQIEGLLSYLGKSINSLDWKDNLYTIDFICHGVPSRMVWRRYLEETSNNKKICHINFRDKSYGWTNYCLKIDYSDNSFYACAQNKDTYLRGFINNLYLRESCYKCAFKGIDRVSDFTIADFWGAKTMFPNIFDDKGISIIMTHSDKSRLFLEELKNELFLYPIDNESIVNTNSSLIKSSARNNKREKFFRLIRKSSVKVAISQCLHRSLMSRIIYRIGHMIR